MIELALDVKSISVPGTAGLLLSPRSLLRLAKLSLPDVSPFVVLSTLGPATSIAACSDSIPYDQFDSLLAHTL